MAIKVITVLCIIHVVSLINMINGQWIQGTPSLSEIVSASAAGYDSTNNKIWLIGGRKNGMDIGKQVLSFDLNTNSVSVEAPLPSIEDFEFFSQAYTQIGNTLYLLHQEGRYLASFEMSTSTFTSPVSNLPTRQRLACLASHGNYLIVAGGYDNKKAELMTTVSIYDIDNSVWITTAQSLPYGADWNSCQVVGNYLYVLSGNSNAYVQKLRVDDINNIASYSWSVVGNLDTTYTLWCNSIVSHDTDIHVIGGTNFTSFGNAIYIIDTTTDTITTADESFLYNKAAGAVVVADDIAYYFGGSTGSTQWSYNDMTTASPTASPTTASPTTDSPTASPTATPTASPTEYLSDDDMAEIITNLAVDVDILDLEDDIKNDIATDFLEWYNAGSVDDQFVDGCLTPFINNAAYNQTAVKEGITASYLKQWHRNELKQQILRVRELMADAKVLKTQLRQLAVSAAGNDRGFKRAIRKAIRNKEGDTCGPTPAPTTPSFHIGDNKLSWDDSKEYCGDIGLKLASIHSEQDMDIAMAICQIKHGEDASINHDDGCWIGLNDQHTEGIWRYVDGSRTDYGFINNDRTRPDSYNYPWIHNEPNDYGSGEDCIHLWALRGYELNDNRCDKANYPLCI